MEICAEKQSTKLYDEMLTCVLAVYNASALRHTYLMKEPKGFFFFFFFFLYKRPGGIRFLQNSTDVFSFKL